VDDHGCRHVGARPRDRGVGSIDGSSNAGGQSTGDDRTRDPSDSGRRASRENVGGAVAIGVDAGAAHYDRAQEARTSRNDTIDDVNDDDQYYDVNDDDDHDVHDHHHHDVAPGYHDDPAAPWRRWGWLGEWWWFRRPARE
jgi:hypothetical protein